MLGRDARSLLATPASPIARAGANHIRMAHADGRTTVAGRHAGIPVGTVRASERQSGVRLRASARIDDALRASGKTFGFSPVDVPVHADAEKDCLATATSHR